MIDRARSRRLLSASFNTSGMVNGGSDQLLHVSPRLTHLLSSGDRLRVHLPDSWSAVHDRRNPAWPHGNGGLPSSGRVGWVA